MHLVAQKGIKVSNYRIGQKVHSNKGTEKERVGEREDWKGEGKEEKKEAKGVMSGHRLSTEYMLVILFLLG